MADIAELGFAADTGALKDAKASLDALVPSAAKSERASNKLAQTLGKVDASADKLMAAANGLVGATDKLARVLDNQGTAAQKAAAGMETNATASRTATTAMTGMTVAAAKVSVTFNQQAAAVREATGALDAQASAAGRAGANLAQLDSHVEAYRANLRQMKIDQLAAGAGMGQLDAHVMAYRDHLDTVGVNARKAGQQIKFTAVEGLNASRQLADIGVTAASGMSPFLIALQQGPQLFDILQQKAVMTGASISTVFRAAAASIMAMLAPLLPIVLAITAVIGTIAAGFALGARQINASNKDIIGGLDLTEKQLQKVKKAGVDTTVTLSDTFKAFFQVLGERIVGSVAGPLDTFKKKWNEAMNAITEFGRWAIKDVVGTFVGAYYAIIALWKNMPTTFSGIGALVANAFIASFETLVNRAIQQVNGINEKVNGALAAVGLDLRLKMFDPVKMGRVANQEASAAADGIVKGFKEGYAKAGAATDRFFADVSKRAVKNRKAAIKAAAGDAEKGPKAPKPKKPKFDDGVDRITPPSWDITADRQLPIDMKVDVQPFPIDALDKYLERWRAAVEDAKGIAKSFVTDLQTNLKNGENIFSSFAKAALNALNSIANKLLDKALDAGLNALFGSAGGKGGSGIGSAIAGLFMKKNAKGNAFDSGGVHRFARGDAFTNSVVNRPTPFKFGKGGANLGIMGEAGPEAVMPLTRGPNGSLGVQTYGGSAPSQPQQVHVTVGVEEGQMFRPVVRGIAQEEATGAMTAGLKQYDGQLATRFDQVASDPRVRG